MGIAVLFQAVPSWPLYGVMRMDSGEGGEGQTDPPGQWLRIKVGTSRLRRGPRAGGLGTTEGQVFPGGSAHNDSSCNAGDLGLIPGLGRYPREGNGYPLQYSALENSMDCIVHGVTKSWMQLSEDLKWE